MIEVIKIPEFNDQGKPRAPLPAADLEAALAFCADELRQNPLFSTGRDKITLMLSQLGHNYEATICQAGSLVPMLGRGAFPPDVPSFSVHDADAGQRGVRVLPAPPPSAQEGELQEQNSPFVAVLEQGRCAVGPLGYAVFARDGSYAVDFCRNDGPLDGLAQCRIACASARGRDSGRHSVGLVKCRIPLVDGEYSPNLYAILGENTIQQY